MRGAGGGGGQGQGERGGEEGDGGGGWAGRGNWVIQQGYIEIAVIVSLFYRVMTCSSDRFV